MALLTSATAIAVVQVRERRAEQLLASCQTSYTAFHTAGRAARDALGSVPSARPQAERALRVYVQQARLRPECYEEPVAQVEVARVAGGWPAQRAARRRLGGRTRHPVLVEPRVPSLSAPTALPG